MRRILSVATALPLLCGLSTSRGDVYSDVPEAGQYDLLYSLDINASVNYATDGVPYEVDKSKTINRPIDRVAYYMTLGGSTNTDDKNGFVFASMDAFTQDLGKLGVPTVASDALWQRNVANMNVFSNVAGITNGTGITTGNIEFWPSSYTAGNSASIPNATDAAYDWGDTHSGKTVGYGSMQIHNHALTASQQPQVLMAFNGWNGNSPVDVGIGNGPVKASVLGPSVDWTFTGNGANYTSRRLQVFVHYGDAPTPPPPESRGVKVLCLGDSITYGALSPSAYRTGLYSRLTAAGYNINFLGSDTRNANPLLTAAGETEHEGHGGYTALDVYNNLDGNVLPPPPFGPGSAADPNNGGYWITGGNGTNRPAVQPDFVLLHIGTNDILGNAFSLTPAQNEALLETRMNQLLDKLVTLLPDTKVMLASIIPIDTYGLNERVINLNDFIEHKLVPRLQGQGKHVYFVDQYSSFINPATGAVIPGLLPDGVHPDEVGYELMAENWSRAIQAVPEPGAVMVLALVVLLPARRYRDAAS